VLDSSRGRVGELAREHANSKVGLARRAETAEGAHDGGAARRGSGELSSAKASARKGGNGVGEFLYLDMILREDSNSARAWRSDDTTAAPNSKANNGGALGFARRMRRLGLDRVPGGCERLI
jgi:hypothetical protein